MTDSTENACPHPRLSLIYAEPNGRWECEVCKEVLTMREVFAVPEHASPAENDVACRYCGVGDRVCIEYNESGRGIKCCPDCDHRPAAEKDACPRCGHNEPRDLTRLPNGDHLVMEEGPLELGQRPDTPTNSFIFTATRDVRFVWCSTRVLPSGAHHPRCTGQHETVMGETACVLSPVEGSTDA